ncbi:MAG: cupredoxin domain-containing protein [Thiotrichales bacterium]|nr:MAG: cupredoxin domain-containing protein [Thiotrichales bacterium]
MKLKAAILSLVLCVTSSVVIASGDDLVVIIKDYKFIPQEITIKKGQTLTWENREKRQYHSVWFEALGEPEPEDYLFPEDTYERKFSETGSFPYRCGPHPEMTGVIHVTE